jgi:hypothetical protein
MRMMEQLRAQPGTRLKSKIEMLLPVQDTNMASKSRMVMKCMMVVLALAKDEALLGKREA